MKICSKCKLELPLDNFNKKGESVQPYCRPCDNARSRNYYASNKEHHKKVIRDRNKKYIDEVRFWIREIKEANPCLDCGISYPYYVMDFDHVKGKKNGDISRMVGSAVAKAKIIEEISKCEIVCSNCHRERTHMRKS